MKKIKTVFKWIIVLSIITNAIIYLTGTTYLYKAVRHLSPDIDDHKIFASRSIPASSAPAPWPMASDNGYQIQISDKLRTTLERYQTVAFLVLSKDSIRNESYWHGYTDSSFSNSFSVAKSVVSALIGIAIREGKIIDVDQKVSDFLPEFGPGKDSDLTIEHLLTMSSGLNWEESFWNPLAVTTRAYYGKDLRKTVLSQYLVEEPGKHFVYRSGDTQLLAMILEKVTGMRLSEYAHLKLWEPLGAEKDAFWSLDDVEGDEKAFCCMYSNARDYARLGMLYLKKGNWKGRQLIDTSYIDRSVTPNGHITDLETGSAVDHFGYTWWVIPEHNGQKIFYARGILGQYVIVIPDMETVIVRLGHDNAQKRGQHYEDVYLIIDEVMKMLGPS